MKFADNHANIEADCLAELKRRVQWWASAPGEDGGALKPDAQIVPLETLRAAIAELDEWRKIGAKIASAKTRGSA